MKGYIKFVKLEMIWTRVGGMINLKLQDKNIVHCDYTTQGYGSSELKYGKNRGYVAKSSSLDNRIQRSASLNTIL